MLYVVPLLNSYLLDPTSNLCRIYCEGFRAEIEYNIPNNVLISVSLLYLHRQPVLIQTLG